MRSPMRVPAVVRENTYLKIRTLAQRLLSRLAPERLAWAEMKLMGIKRLPRWPALSRSSGGGAVYDGRGSVLMMAGAQVEEVAQFVVGAAEPSGRSGAFEAPPHGPITAFDALMSPVSLS